MTRKFPLALLVLCLLGGAPAWAAAPLGMWWNARRDIQVEVVERDAGLTGTIVWLGQLNADGLPWRDAKNPDPTLRGRPLEGMMIFCGLTPRRRAGQWGGGTLYDPHSGNTYRCRLILQEADVMEVRGYLGIALFGRTMTWYRGRLGDPVPAGPAE